MHVVFNIIVILLVVLIAYWWANQGLFSALLHLLCVIVAGAIAFAFWEPLTFLLLRGSKFDDYAWGVLFIGLFAVSLFILRLILDRTAPANVTMPHWANLGFGAVAGAAAGTLTIGIFIIGAGFIQSHAEFMGFKGHQRNVQTSHIEDTSAGLWFPVHKLTGQFYSYLSVNALDTARPLRQYNPEIYNQCTLVRDTFNNGRGKLSLQPSQARIVNFYAPPDGGRRRYFVEVHFEHGAHDFGEQLTLASSQVRLIGRPTTSKGAPEILYPVAWLQHSGYHRFDHVSHVASSVPGQQTSDILLEFRAGGNFSPNFIQIRNTRYTLPRANANLPLSIASRVGTGEVATTTVQIGGPLGDSIYVNNDIRPIVAGTNSLPPTINYDEERYLSDGRGRFARGGVSVPMKLRIQGIREPAGTRCIKLDVSRGGTADIFAIVGQIPEDATLALVDTQGIEYSPVGYMYTGADQVTEICLEPARLLQTVRDLPVLPTSGNQRLLLLFYVTEGSTIAKFRFGDLDIGTCNLLVPRKVGH